VNQLGTCIRALKPQQDIVFKDCAAVNPGIMRPNWYGNCVATYGHLDRPAKGEASQLELQPRHGTANLVEILDPG